LAIGAAAYSVADDVTVAAHLTRALQAGCNTLDVAPAYGAAIELLGPLLPAVREQLFVACKTGAREAGAARAELEDSLTRLGVGHFDLFQMHAVRTDEELDAVCGPDGAATALLRARDEGLTRFVGVTGHFQAVPRLFRSMLDRLDLDTVMLPVNASMLALPDYRRALDDLAAVVAERDLGVLAIKVFARGPWRGPVTRTAWYEPWEDREQLQACLDLTLSVPGVPCVALLPGDVELSLRILDEISTDRRLEVAQVDQHIAECPDQPLLAPVGT
jgi:aryl-alcohol dehydrogenase-like predicted oxidoreductase